jgi:hypothetical protein
MDDDIKVLERTYDRFNARDIDGVPTASVRSVTLVPVAIPVHPIVD